MNRLLKALAFAAPLAAVALTLSATSARAQQIYVVQGGRTTVTLSKAFLDDLTILKITPTTLYS